MQYFPMFLKMAGRRVVVVGGGEIAARKVRLILKTEASIVVAADRLDDELESLAAAGRIAHRPGPLATALFQDAALVFVGTGCAGADAAAQALAKAAGAVVNVVDAPDLSDAVTPAIVDRDPVVVAIGTEGTAPVLARQVKTRVEEMLEPRLGELAALAGRLRRSAARLAPRQRRDLWRWAFGGAPRAAHQAGREREAARMIKDAVAEGRVPDATGGGLVSLVGAGPGAPDLITLRGVKRLQEADVIFYDRLANAELLELARRDAERVFVGKTPGLDAWPQARINGVIVAAARQGKRVVRLKSGDPCLFGRLGEETSALDAAGLAWEIVPGVTAASAAAASVGRSLTERGAIDTVVFTTGQSRAGDPPPPWRENLRDGVAMAFYMAVSAAGEVQAELLDSGNDPNLEVTIVQAIGAPEERRLETTLGRLAATIRDEAVANPAVLIVRRPKRRQAAAVLRLPAGAEREDRLAVAAG